VPRILVVETSTAIVPSWRLLGPSDIFSNELLCVVSIGVICCGEEFSDCGRPFAQ
jgi:hypothetical protein